MKLGLFFRLAWSNIKKNHQLYIPHILAGMGLTGIFYVMFTLGNDDRLYKIKGGYAIPDIMMIGIWVVIILSVILVFFTNSFLMKQRTREYGMYNVLGMEKRHVGRIMFIENLISTVFSITGGILAGILVYKLCCLFICKMLRVDTILGFYMNWKCLWKTAASFAAMYLAAFLWNRLRLAKLRPVELLASAGTGEREPKTKWILLLIGLATLGTGYYLALSAESPLQVIKNFFIAVILVIVGTYALFLAGSVALLKFLRRKKGFYYRRTNMIAVSDLLYRMKQNAIGLASIAILATGVLVMISTTVSLYAGLEDTLKKSFMDGAADVILESEYNYKVDGDEKVHFEQVPEEVLRETAERVIEQYGTKVTKFTAARNISEDFLVEKDGTTQACTEGGALDTPPENMVIFVFLPAEDYRNITGIDEQFGDGELGWAPISKGAKELTERVSGTLKLGGKTYQLTKKLSYFPEDVGATTVVDVYGIVLPDIADLEAVSKQIEEDLPGYANRVSYMYLIKVADEKAISANDSEQNTYSAVSEAITDYVKENYGTDHVWVKWGTIWAMRYEMYAVYGSLFFLGILLSIVFLFATALIIYYKQISEGYDDRRRFQILLKVGMTPKETKGTIRRQIVIVFFLPVITAVLHITVAYPVIHKLLALLQLYNDSLFLMCTVLTVVAFTAIYMIIYRLTARTYYRIVR